MKFKIQPKLCLRNSMKLLVMFIFVKVKVHGNIQKNSIFS